MYRRKYYLENKEEISSKAKENYRLNKDRWKHYGRKHRYGISQEDFEKLYSEYSGCCHMCGRKEDEQQRELGVDHDHSTGTVRGLLCNYCNLYVGHVENERMLLLAREYLARYS